MCETIKHLATKRDARKTGGFGSPMKTPTKAIVYRLRKLACVMYGRLRTPWFSRHKHRPLRET